MKALTQPPAVMAIVPDGAPTLYGQPTKAVCPACAKGYPGGQEITLAAGDATRCADCQGTVGQPVRAPQSVEIDLRDHAAAIARDYARGYRD